MAIDGSLSREQAIALVGLALVEEVESKSCDFTGRTQDDNRVEFCASICIEPAEDGGVDRFLSAYYYQDQKTLDEIEDFDSLDWAIECYRLG